MGYKVVDPTDLTRREEYISGDEDSEDEQSTEVAAIAITWSTTPSLFESPNEDVPTTSDTCLMAKATDVISSSTPKTMNDMHDNIGLRIKEENVALDRFMSNLKGEAKGHFESLLRDYGMAQDLLEEKGRLEREYAWGKAWVSWWDTWWNWLKSSKIKRFSLPNINWWKKEKAEFVVANVRRQGEFERLDKAHKALESEHSILVKSHEQLATTNSAHYH